MVGVEKFTAMLFRSRARSQKGMIPVSGGAVLAFVGPEATGKSTLLAEMRRWLGEHFAVEQIHAGKPKSTLLTVVPNYLVPTLRVALPTFRSSQVEAQSVSDEKLEKPRAVFPLIFAVRSVLLAYDRRALLTRAFGRAANGTIVLCDRYPLLSAGIPDGPQLLNLLDGPDQYPIKRLLARIEQRLYQEIPPPDLVIALSVPLDVAILRNRTRGKTEPEDYVRMRHAKSSNLEFEKTSVYKINTNQPFENTVLEVKKAIWNIL
jgi:thymidylate kinase